MTIDLAPDLTWVDELYGGAWPAVDEDHLFDLAGVWHDSAQDLRNLDSDAHSTAKDLARNNIAHPIEAFGLTWRHSHFNLQVAAEALDLSGETLHSVGLAVQAAKIAIQGIFALTATRVIYAKKNAFYAPLLAAEEAFRAVAAGRKAVEITLVRLQRFIDEEIGEKAHQKTLEILSQIKPVGNGVI